MKRALLMLVLQLGANGADAYFTHRNLARWNFREQNPIARPFVRNTPDLIVSSAAGLGFTLYAEHLFRKHDHPKFARTLEFGSIAGHTFGAINSARQYKAKP